MDFSGYTEDHLAFRDTLRKFVDTRIAPYVDQWDEKEEFPRELYREAGEIGLLGLGFDEEYGGISADSFYTLLVCEELARPGSGGLSAGLMSHTIAAPPIDKLGSPELKQRVLPDILSGEKIAALAVTEPSGGSDVANLKTSAHKDGEHYILNGSKTFITSGMRADYLTVAARTGGPGAEGISIFLVETDREGVERTPLKKMGWWASDTATIYLDNCKIPQENLIGEENMGFLGIMLNFNQERLSLAATSWAFAKVCYQEALEWAQERNTFGKPLISRQVIRHKLVDMATQIAATEAYLERMAHRIDAAEAPVAEICMLKNTATRCVEFCAKEAVQILGGAGFIRGAKSERIYRETKVLSIGGGTEEIMKELASRQLGW